MTALRNIEALADAGLIASDLSAAESAALEEVSGRYSIAISAAVVDRIDLAHLATDPVARQFVPDVRELNHADSSLSDPIGDDVHSPLKGLVHRYPDRVLLKATEVCPVYCRFCFRRETVGGNAARPLTHAEFAAIFAYVDAHPRIWEVIVSGGDPLVLSNARLRTLLAGLARAPHVKVIRFHTRVPVVTPERIDAELLEILQSTDKTVYMAIHANHAQEFDAAARTACTKLVDSGVALLSQSVLLRGVNDSASALGDLMRTFVELRITPYYLHQLDLAPGTEHFRVPLREGQALLRELRGTWSGLCQPDYVIDLPGGFGKVSIGPDYVAQGADDDLQITDPNGDTHSYIEPAPEAQP